MVGRSVSTLGHLFFRVVLGACKIDLFDELYVLEQIDEGREVGVSDDLLIGAICDQLKLESRPCQDKRLQAEM